MRGTETDALTIQQKQYGVYRMQYVVMALPLNRLSIIYNVNLFDAIHKYNNRTSLCIGINFKPSFNVNYKYTWIVF